MADGPAAVHVPAPKNFSNISHYIAAAHPCRRLAAERQWAGGYIALLEIAGWGGPWVRFADSRDRLRRLSDLVLLAIMRAALADISLDIPDTQPEDEGPFRVNLFLLIFFGVGVSMWIWWHTDWFAEFAEVLALGGIFSWIAFVSNLLRGERIESFKLWIDKRFFSWRATPFFLAAILLAGVLSLFLGSVQVDSFDSNPRPIQASFEKSVVESHSTTEVELDRLVPAQHYRRVFWATWLSGQKVRVKVKGFPAKVTSVYPWFNHPLYAPSSFLRPVVLLKPTLNLLPWRSQKTKDSERRTTIVVTIDGKRLPEVPFDGHAIWVGCDGDVEIPQKVAEELQQEIRVNPDLRSQQNAARFWLNPVASPVLSELVLSDDTAEHNISAHVVMTTLQLDSDGKLIPVYCSVGSDAGDQIRKPRTFLDFPQVVSVDYGDTKACPK